MSTTHDRNRSRQQFFNSPADHWLERCYTPYREGRDPDTARKIERVLDAAGLDTGMIVADVGCGTGVLAGPILKRLGSNGKLYEIDFAARMIAVNRQLHRDNRIRFLTADVMALPVAPESCHAVIAFCCLPHFDDKAGALTSLRTILKPGGRLIVSHLDSAADLNAFHRSTDPVVSEDSLPDADALTAMLERAGFTVDEAIDRKGFYLVRAER